MSIEEEVAGAPTSAGEAAATPRLERSYDDGQVHFVVTADAGDQVTIVVRGRGTLAGAERMIEYLDEALAGAGPGRQLRLFFDVARVRGAPLRSQLLFGRWLFGHRRALRRAVVFGAAAWERRLATVVCKVGGFDAFRFFDEQHGDDARRWLADG